MEKSEAQVPIEERINEIKNGLLARNCDVDCDKFRGFVGMFAETILEGYRRVESERAADRKSRELKALRTVAVDELEQVDTGSLKGLHKLAVEGFGDAVRYVVRARYWDGRREGVGVFLRLREGVGFPVAVGNLDDLIPGVDAQFYDSLFRLNIFGRAGCAVRFLQVEGGAYIELGAGDVGGLSSLALVGLCKLRLEPFYEAVLRWVAGLMPFEEGEIELAGYDEVVRRCELVLGCKDPRLMRRHVLLAGPPGCGKSMIAKMVAEAHSEFVRFNLTRGDDWVSLVRMLSKLVEGCGKRVLLVADEIDELGLSREGGGESVYELLRLLDGVGSSRNVVVIATTSRPEALDPALVRPGRFGPVITVALPDEGQRARIVEHFSSKYGGVVNAVEVAGASACSGAEIRAAVEDCVMDGVPVTTGAVLENLRRNPWGEALTHAGRRRQGPPREGDPEQAR